MTQPRGTKPRRYLPLFHRVAALNALLLLLAVGVTILVLVPGHESTYKIDEEGIVLVLAVIVVVLLNLVLLRRVVRPVQELTAVARTVDLADPTPPIAHAEANSEAGELALTFNDMLERLRTERREATGRILAAQEAERLRIAQELHDQVGQDLTAALLLLSRLHARVPAQLDGAVSQAQDSIRASLEDVRRIAVELRPEALDDLGLASALAVLCDRLAERIELDVTCHIDEPLPALPAEAQLVVYRIAQEALTNVARHSGSKRAALCLRCGDDYVELRVRDEGRGLPPGLEPGSGMRGMRERAQLVGATLDIHDHPGGGTEVLLRLPQ